MHGYLAIHNQVWLRLPIDEAQWVHSILCRPLCTYFLLAYRCCNHAIHNNLCNNSRRYASSQWCNPLDRSAYQLTLYYLVMRSASHHITFVLKSSYLVVIFFSPLLLLMVMKLQSKIKINLLLKKCVPLHKTTKGIVQIKNTSLPYYTSSSMFTTTITYLLKKYYYYSNL